MKNKTLYIQILVVAILVFIVDLFASGKENISVLIAILFWAAIGQGLIALTAIIDLSQGKWAAGIKPYLHAYYPLLLIFPLAFLTAARHVGAYDWSHHPTGWLDPAFFISRNVIFLFLPFVFAHLYVKASRNESKKTGTYAVLYLLFFVISQSFLAYDQVMTFDYPWINTLMGPFFFVEALFAAIAFSAVLSGTLYRSGRSLLKKAHGDFVVMIQGFALFWAGLFYSQYLVIWYGNIPEEVGYISIRLAIPQVKVLGIFCILSLFVLPFVALIVRKFKQTAAIVYTIVGLIFMGLIGERIIYLLPRGNMTIPAVLFPMLILGAPFLYLFVKQLRTDNASANDGLKS